MALLNHAKKELNAKIVYYGPGLSGKTTNLEWIHKKMDPEKRGKLISLETKTDRTLFFDFLPVQIGEIAGYRMRFNVYTVPGQIFYNETRKMVLKGVDGIVFVADCQREMASENVESLKNLGENLASIEKDVSQVPLVLQYNKMDLPNTLTVEELNHLLNPDGRPFFEAIAVQGEGVLTTLARITRMVAEHLRNNLFQEPRMPAAKAEPARQPAAAASRAALGGPAPAFLSADAPPQAALRAPDPALENRKAPVPQPMRRMEPDPFVQDSPSAAFSGDLFVHDPAGNELTRGREAAGTANASRPARRAPQAPTALAGGQEVDFPLHAEAINDPPPRTQAAAAPSPRSFRPETLGEGILRDAGAEASGPERWVDPSVIRFPPADSEPVAVPAPAADLFAVRIDGAQGEFAQEIEVPLRIRRKQTGEEICFRLRIQIDACKPTH